MFSREEEMLKRHMHTDVHFRKKMKVAKQLPCSALVIYLSWFRLCFFTPSYPARSVVWTTALHAQLRAESKLS